MSPPALPPELISSIFECLPSDDPESVPTLLASSLASRSFHNLATAPLVWIPHIHWTRSTARLLPTDHPFLFYKARATLDAIASRCVRTLSRSPAKRLAPIERIKALGTDVVEVLARLMVTTEEEDPDFYLSTRYWAGQAWEAVLRGEAIETWRRLADEADEDSESASSFEDGVLAFVAFRGGDPESVRTRFDHAMIEMEAHCQNSLQDPQAMLVHVTKSVCSNMKTLGFKPATGEAFHNLNNHFLDAVWADADSDSPTHPARGTLPLSLVAIFCSFIYRLPTSFNIQAAPVGFPGMVVAVVSTRDGSAPPIYVSVYEDGKILALPDLRRMAEAMGLSMLPEYLVRSSAKEMCHRIARNILLSVRTRNPEGNPFALYATARAFFIFSPGPLQAYAEWLASLIQSPDFSLDVAFLESEELRNALGSEEKRDEVAALCESIREQVGEEVEVRKRTKEIVWKVGHVFVHRLFGYVAVIRGFDLSCEASETWIQQMRVDTLPGGRHQPFYHVVASDGTFEGKRLYVASENVTTTPVPQERYEELAALKSIGFFFRKKGTFDGRPGFLKSVSLAAEYVEED